MYSFFMFYSLYISLVVFFQPINFSALLLIGPYVFQFSKFDLSYLNFRNFLANFFSFLTRVFSVFVSFYREYVCCWWKEVKWNICVLKNGDGIQRKEVTFFFSNRNILKMLFFSQNVWIDFGLTMFSEIIFGRLRYTLLHIMGNRKLLRNFFNTERTSRWKMYAFKESEGVERERCGIHWRDCQKNRESVIQWLLCWYFLFGNFWYFRRIIIIELCSNLYFALVVFSS